MDYEQAAFDELQRWKKEMLRKPSFLNKLSKKVQVKLNSYIPEKIHHAITTTIKQMVRTVLFGAQYTTKKPVPTYTLQQRKTLSKSSLKHTNTPQHLKVALPVPVVFYWGSPISQFFLPSSLKCFST
jgi:hypothetical protein